MGTISVITGPMAGQQFESLWDLMSAEAEMRAECPHDEREIETGYVGRRSKRYTRERCMRCKAIVGSTAWEVLKEKR